MRNSSIAVALASLSLLGSSRAQGLEGYELQRALKDHAADFWIYDDIEAGIARARKLGKPLLISFRCVP